MTRRTRAVLARQFFGGLQSESRSPTTCNVKLTLTTGALVVLSLSSLPAQDAADPVQAEDLWIKQQVAQGNGKPPLATNTGKCTTFHPSCARLTS